MKREHHDRAGRRLQDNVLDRIPAWLPPALYLFATLVLFREVVFGAPLLGRDTFALSYFAREFYTDFVRETGRFPLWDPYVLGGLPFVDGMHGDIFYPPSLAMFVFDALHMWGIKMMLHVWLAGVFAYLFLRELRLSRGAALFGGLVFMMGPDLVSLVFPGGDGKLFVSALAPLVFWLAERAARHRRASDFAWFALGIALVVFTSHMQLAYFTVWGVSLWFLFRIGQTWRSGEKRAAGGLLAMFAVAGLLGMGAATVQFIPPLNYLREWSHRAERTVEAEGQSGYEYSATWSLHPEEAASLIVPEFVGDNAATDVRGGDRYWGRNAFKWNHEYAGLVPLLLIPILFLRRRTPETWFFALLAVLSVLYGLGANTPLFRLFYLIPGVNLFRAPSLIIFLYGLSIAVLGAMAVDRLAAWTTQPTEQTAVRKTLWIIAGVFLVLALLQSGGILTNLWQSISPLGARRAPALQANLASIQLGFWISFLLALLVASLWEALSRGAIGMREAVFALALLAFFDSYRIGRPFVRATVLMAEARLQQDPTLLVPDESIRFLQERQASGEVFRVYDLGYHPGINAPAYDFNALALHRIEQLGGHHGNEIGRYRELVGGDAAVNVAASQLRLLNLANVGYVVIGQRIENQGGLEEVFVGSRSAVYRNTAALPRVYLAGTVQVVPDDSAVQHLLAAEFDMRSTVTLPEPLPAGTEVQAEPQGTVEWVERGTNAYTLRVTSDRPALLVISENYYPAWKAAVDGEAAPVLRANYTFRAIPVGAGEHTVRLEYDSDTLDRSALASVSVLVLLLAVALAGTLRRRPEVAA